LIAGKSCDVLCIASYDEKTYEVVSVTLLI